RVAVEEVVVDPVDLVRAPGAGGRRDRERERLFVAQAAYHRALADPGRARDDDQPAAPLSQVGRGGRRVGGIRDRGCGVPDRCRVPRGGAWWRSCPSWAGWAAR